MKLSFEAHSILFKHPFKIAHGVRSHTDIVICKLEYENTIAYGEASLPPYLEETTSSVFSFLKKAQVFLQEKKYPFAVEEIVKQLDELDVGNCAAKACVDIALHDLLGKLLGKPCWQLFGLNKNKTPLNTYTIGIDAPKVIQQKVKEGEAFKIFKVKLNGEHDKLIIESIRSVSDKPIVVDINQAWTDKIYAHEMIDWMKEKNVLFVEQPFSKTNYEDANWLYEKTSLPIFADESIQRFSDLERMKNSFHGINIKLMKCTGLVEAQRMIKEARSLNLKILLGCMTESSCGISAAAQLSPLVDYTDLDSPLLIKNDLFEGVNYENGKLLLTDKEGLGVRLKQK